MNKNLLRSAVVTLMLVSTQAKADPFSTLIKEMNNKAVFQQTTASRFCPKLITLEETDPHGINEEAKPGDRAISLYSNPGNGSFLHEGNSFYYRPGLTEGRTHVLNRSLTFPAGVAYSTTSQLVEKGVLTAKYSANVGSIFMMGTARFKIQFNENTDLITYHFSGMGVDDVNCAFKRVR